MYNVYVLRFGCCEDNSTAATGPEGQGCQECEKSEFGCCLDGFTPATGENYTGCPEGTILLLIN